MADLQRGADVEIDVTNSTALNLVDNYAIHLREKGQKSETPIAKFCNAATTGYTVRLFDVSLSSTPATFTMKIERTVTASFSPSATIEAMLYTQITNTDYEDNDFRPSSDWTVVGTATKELVVTTTLGV
tara:strand:- start:1112 stop:1498 length:387 start_codon:yes stop_codon:yes gene_type:complete